MVKRTGGTDSARYCYSTWLRHLVMGAKAGLETNPDSLAELGPGDSIGIGLAAMLSGCNKYYGLDIVQFSQLEPNLAVLEQLVELYRKRTPIPDASEFPHLKPYLDSYEFPGHILDGRRLSASLSEKRLTAIRQALQGLADGRTEDASDSEIKIEYCVPWIETFRIPPESLDMVLSQAVLEHVDDLPRTYAALSRWLKPGAFASHEIGFVSHGLTHEWNGHWTISSPVWRLMRGRRAYLINRMPASWHERLIRESGLIVVNEKRERAVSEIGRDELAKPFREMSDEDLTTLALFIQARKPPAREHGC